VVKTTIICIKFLPDVACQKLLQSANFLWIYLKIKVASSFVDHCVVKLEHIVGGWKAPFTVLFTSTF